MNQPATAPAARAPGAGRSWRDRQVWRASAADLALTATVLVWIGSVLLLDAVPGPALQSAAHALGLAGAGAPVLGDPAGGGQGLDGLGPVAGVAGVELVRQVLLGIVTWALLLGLLRRESTLVRTQTLVVVALATCVEYTFSPLLQAYVYRIGTVPLFVPPGHGLVYLAALAFGRSRLVAVYRRPLLVGTVLVGTAWAVGGVLTGLVGTGRTDVLGAFWFCCLLGFLAVGPSRTVYLGAFLVVSYLELTGTALGTWAWASSDPVLHVIGQGNPPSGAAGGYGWFDLYALLLAPRLLAVVRRGRDVVRRAGDVARRARDDVHPVPDTVRPAGDGGE